MTLHVPSKDYYYNQFPDRNYIDILPYKVMVGTRKYLTEIKMTQLEKKLNDDLLEARKSKPKDTLKANLLITIKGQVDTTSKDPKNELSIDGLINAAAKSIINGLNTVTQTEDTRREIEIASEFLPTFMSEEELYVAIKGMNFPSDTNAGPATGLIMKSFPGQIDGKMVRPVLARVLEESKVILSTDEDKDIFTEAILNPPAPNEKLKRAHQNHQEMIASGKIVLKEGTGKENPSI